MKRLAEDTSSHANTVRGDGIIMILLGRTVLQGMDIKVLVTPDFNLVIDARITELRGGGKSVKKIRLFLAREHFEGREGSDERRIKYLNSSLDQIKRSESR